MRRVVVFALVVGAVASITPVWSWGALRSGPESIPVLLAERSPVGSGVDATGTNSARFEGADHLVTLDERLSLLSLTARLLPLSAALDAVPGAQLPENALGGRLRAAFASAADRNPTLFLVYDSGLEIRERRLADPPDYRAQLATLRRQGAALPVPPAESLLVRIGGTVGLATPASFGTAPNGTPDSRLGELRFWRDGVERVVVGYGRNLAELATVGQSLR